MGNNKTIIDLFPSAIFWDVDLGNLSIDADKRFIIERVLCRNKGRENVMKSLERLYPIEEIKTEALISVEILGNEKIERIAKRYDLDPKEFKNWTTNFKNYA